MAEPKMRYEEPETDVKEKLFSRKTPFFVFDLDRIRENIQGVRDNFSPDKLLYAVKANSHPKVLSTVKGEGCGFEVNNSGELEKVINAGGSVSDCINNSPVTGAREVRELYSKGVRDFCVDSKAQVDNLSYNAPGSDVFVRIYNENKASRFKLNRLGIHTKDAPELMQYAKEQGLNLKGATFHVGSQCSNLDNWTEGIYQSSVLFDKFPELSHLNVGGGLPVQYANEISDMKSISECIEDGLGKYFSRRPAFYIEPGRYIVGDSACTVSTVIQAEEQEDISRAVVDMSVFSGFMEIIEIGDGFRYLVTTDSKGPMKKYHVEGCTCAGTDIIVPEVKLPRLHVDYKNPENSSRVIFENTGAYTLDFLGKNDKSGFNGAPTPPVYFVEGGEFR